jgi:monoamine oxidase
MDDPMEQLEAEYCVVGGGYAGLAAAYRLLQKKHTVIVLEASGHPGGRVWTQQLSDGTPFDIGAAWVASPEAQPDVRKLMRELNVGTYPQFTNGKEGSTVFVGLDGRVSTYQPLSDDMLARLPEFSSDPLLSLAAKADIGLAIFAINEMSKVIHPESPWDDVDLPLTLTVGPKTTREADQITCQTWLDLNLSTPEAKALLSSALLGVFGVSPAAASFLHLLFMVKTFDSNFVNMIGSGKGEAEEFRVQGGFQEMAKRIAKKLGSNLRLETPVRLIQQGARSVTVVADQVTVRARRVIVATGTTMANTIRFDPILPSARALLQQRMPQGEVWKIWLCYDRPFWRDKTRGQLNGESVSIDPRDYVANARDAGADPKQKRAPGLMNAFVAGDRAREFDAMGRAGRKKQVLKELVKRFGKEAGQLSKKITFPVVLPQNPEPDAYFEWNWAFEEFARGDYAALPGPGVLTALGFGDAIRAPFKRVHWASVDAATFPYASVSGAIQSGVKTADEVMAAG